MNRVKLQIKTSENKNLKYKVYRSVKQEEIPAVLDVLQNLQPVIEVDETVAPKKLVEINDQLIVDVSTKSTDNMVKYIMKHKPVKSDMTDMEIQINFNAPDQVIEHEKITLHLAFDNANNISNLVVTYKDGSKDVFQTVADVNNVLILGDDSISINNLFTEGCYNIKYKCWLEVIEVYDYNKEPVAGIVYNGPEPSGLRSPDFNAENKIHYITDKINVPYIRITPQHSELGVIYYYRIVGVDPSNNITLPSPLIAANLAQSPDVIKYEIEASDDFNTNPDEASWYKLPVILDGNEIIDIGKPGTLNYNSLGEAVVEEVPMFRLEDVKTDLRYVNSDNRVMINIPNVWKQDDPKYNYRVRKSYRLTAKLGNYSSEVSNVISLPSKAHIPIEKMVLLKRNATNDDDIYAPSTVEQEGAEALRVWIRKNGLYYDELEHSVLPYNLPNSKTTMSLASNYSIFDTFEIEDDSCVPGQSYNYTIYLYDSYGKQSKPISIAIRL